MLQRYMKKSDVVSNPTQANRDFPGLIQERSECNSTFANYSETVV